MAIATYGDLRKQLATEGIQWTVNPALADSAPIVRPHLGGDPAQFTLAKDAPAVDVAKLVAANPTTNTLLRAHLVSRGLLPASLAPTVGITTQRSATPALKTAVAAELKLTLPVAGGAPPAPAPAASGGSGGSLPTSVDWRNRWTWNFVTGIRDQDPCEHCWIYAATALVESMVRIEHCVWCDRSEGDYIEANKVICGQCGGAGGVLDWYSKNGVADQACVPWVDSDPGTRTSTYWNPAPQSCGGGSMVAPPAYAPPSNRDGKIVKIPEYTTLGDVTAQKNWIDAIGPLVCGFEVYDDFSSWSGSKPYIKSSTATDRGSHVMLIVGYDDTLQCWIVKNSWGNWGNNGFGLIGYGQCNIDVWSKIGLQYTNPDPWTKHREHAGGMIESGDGNLHRNFELLARTKGNAFTHFWRDNSANGNPWHKNETMANDVALDLTLTGTTYNRNFETVYRTTANRLHHWYYDQASSKWVDGPVFGPANAQGCVGFCESDFGIGNLEVVVAVAGGTMEHWFRAGSTWAKSVSFGANVLTAGPSLLETSWGVIEFVATLENGTMQHWYRNGANWIGDQVFGSGVKSHACMIQGQFGFDDDKGNGTFDLCVAMPNGTVQHWWRTNAAPFTWSLDATFGSGINYVVALLQGSFGFNLEMIVLRTDGQLQHYWRDDGGWHAGVLIGSTL